MGYVNSVLMGVSKCPNPTVFQKTLSLNDFYLASKEWDYPMGHISFVGKLDRDTLRAGAPAIAPGFTLELMAQHSLDFWLTSEDLPDPNNRVTVDPAGNIVLSYQPNNEEAHKRLIAKLKDLLNHQSKCPPTVTNIMWACFPGTCSSASKFHWPVWPIRTEPSVSNRIQRAQPSTAIAKHTS